MSYISIRDFIQDGRKSLEAKNYWSALSVALMLPSMCSRLAYANNTDYRWENGKFRDKKCYVDWCRENIDKDGWIISFLGENYAEVLYDIRCDIVHAGYAQVYPDHYPDGLGFYFSIGDELSTELTKYRIINVFTLCKQLFINAESWCSKFGADGFKYTRVFNNEDRDDRLLYQRLCDNERADYLEEKFNEENTNHLK